MLTKLKLYAGLALTALIGFLGAMVSIRTNQRDKAISETEKTETELDKVVEVNEHNQEVKRHYDAIQEAREDVNSASDSDISDRMHKYDRARSNKD